MSAWDIVDVARAPDGGELVLYRRGDEWMIRDNGLELMSTRAHFSEEAFARIALLAVGPVRSAMSALIGGLGLGYTLKEAARLVPPDAEIVVAELLEALVRWHEGPLAPLGALGDRRVRVAVADVADVIAAAPSRFDAILLDVDNGPGAIMRSANARLYSSDGLERIRLALRPGGVLAVWAASEERSFEERLRASSFDVSVHAVPARGVAGDPEHTIYIARA